MPDEQLVLLIPVLLLPAVLHPATRAMGLRLAPWAPLPVLLVMLAVPELALIELPWLMLGGLFGADQLGRQFLLFTALVWLIAGLFASRWLRADPRAWRFWAFFLATQAGNLGVCLAQDASGFYLMFALMTFSAYGLVIHDRGDEPRRAGRVYLTMAVLGEALLVAGILLAVHAARSDRLVDIAATSHDAVTLGLLLVGFGVKVGLPLLHMWLPLAHPVAPVPASAVLSGVMLKAGLLGWLRFMPLGAQEAPVVGAVMMVAGLLAMFLGVAAGLAQHHAKVLLAYSSISQMGFMTLAVGAGLLAPALWPLLLPAIVLYALHHALAKSALFLGAGLVRRCGASPWRLAGLTLPALALAGAPLTSGMSAKLALKDALAHLASPWPELLTWLLPLAAMGTALLMLRFLALLADRRGEGCGAGLDLPWALALLAVAGGAWTGLSILPEASSAPRADALWPVLLAAVIYLSVSRLALAIPVIPPGDLLVPLERFISVVWMRARAWQGLTVPVASVRPGVFWNRLDRRARAWSLAGLLWLGVLAVLVWGLFA